MLNGGDSLKYTAFATLLCLWCANNFVLANDIPTPSLDEALIETSLRPTQDVLYKNILHVNKSPAHWQLDVGAAILTRNTLSSSPILIEFFPQPGDLLNASSFRFNTAAGPDISGIKYRDQDLFFDAVGFRYFDVQSMAAQIFTPTTGVTWAFPTSPGSISNTQNVDARYTSRLYSFEANLYHTVEESQIRWLTGFRWLQVSDTLGLVGTNVTGTQTISWNWNAQNNLYGWQVGADFPLIRNSSRWKFSCSPKVGLYGNQCLGRWDDGTPAGTIDNENSVFRNQVAFAGDLSTRLAYSINKAVSIQLGYQLLWLNGIGVAGDQPEVLSGTTIATGLNSSGSAFYHGALAGINFMW